MLHRQLTYVRRIPILTPMSHSPHLSSWPRFSRRRPAATPLLDKDKIVWRILLTSLVISALATVFSFGGEWKLLLAPVVALLVVTSVLAVMRRRPPARHHLRVAQSHIRAPYDARTVADEDDADYHAAGESTITIGELRFAVKLSVASVTILLVLAMALSFILYAGPKAGLAADAIFVFIYLFFLSAIAFIAAIAEETEAEHEAITGQRRSRH